MKKLIGLVLLALLGFYVGWPAWSGYQISQALQGEDAGLLERKIDFPSVRTSLRPVVAAEIERTVERAKRDGGAFGALIAGQIKGDTATRLVDGSLNAVVTPVNIIRMARQGGDLKQAFERVMVEQLGRPGGVPGGLPGGPLGGEAGGLRLPGGLPQGLPGLGRLGQRQGGELPTKPGEPAPPKGQVPVEPQGAATKKTFGLSNVKSFGFNGPLGFSVGVARDPAASVPDLTAHLAFTGWDWKVVGVVPRL